MIKLPTKHRRNRSKSLKHKRASYTKAPSFKNLHQDVAGQKLRKSK